jgi:transcriptional regulator with XRE-family HTH domain
MNIAMRTKIKTLREGKGISQSQMADKLHMDERNYKRIENGEKKIMDTDLLMRLADALDVEPAELLTNETVNIEHSGDNTENIGSIGYAQEMTINNSFPPELKKAYEDMMHLMKDLIAEKNETIRLLKEIKGK